ncbi:vWA domain-containing protein [Halospeciosus flavus]|uniref:VWA domain-containing protein n=1 Tax=Halospeciosus flavus TaxID=3032283 RepID=A0ABD5Z334_9EURY|nr:VWA domain-containing protein [Halospeciosus flavus]
MTDDKNLYNLSRRRLLGGLGAVGLASAGAGLGTSAYFNDTESFDNNTLTAGALDLKVDWQQEYYGPSESWMPVNAYPDTDGDAVQDFIRTRTEIADDEYGETDLSKLSESERQTVEDMFRDQFADLPDDVEMPVIELDDVKPGDKGEITISMHLFDNPGYLWFGGSLQDDLDNGINEPEAEAENVTVSDEMGAPDSGELAEAIQAKVWYDDDCDNRHDTGPACVQLVVDNTDSMGNNEADDSEPVAYKDDLLVAALENLVHDLDTDDDGVLNQTSVGLTLFESIADTRFTPTDDETAVVNGLGDILDQDLLTGGGADVAEAINAGATALEECPEDSQHVLVLITNGVNITESQFLSVATSNLTVNGGSVDKYVVIGLESYASESILSAIEGLQGDHEFIFVDDIDDEIEYAITGSGSVSGPNPDSTLAAEIQDIGGGETIIAEGSLRDVLSESGIGGPSGVLLDANRSSDAIDCYPNSTTQCLAMLWWLPEDVGNEAQTDRVVFDLNLYSEQCRHNPNPAEKTPFA